MHNLGLYMAIQITNNCDNTSKLNKIYNKSIDKTAKMSII